ncbi:hypothetical protein NUW54_g2626 [Trametes sanguinea]|uniref:Uncharacterized protein n=1 Tax=Trametes sanguinea TaxID=158606 RepID=A0ACC1Q6S8_9APHY|nr:hypothetical protein NUW54_g2626 [Trametes sanguinea]
MRLTSRSLGLRQKSFEGEELVPADIHLVALLEAARDHALAHLDGKVDFVDGSEDLVHAADDGLVLEVNGGVEVGDLVGHHGLAEHLVFYRVEEGAHFCASAVPDLQTLLHGPDVNARVVDSAVKIHKSANGTPVNGVEHTPASSVPPETVKDEEVEITTDPEKLPKGPFLEDDVNSGIYPYNAYLHPFTHLKRDPKVNPAMWATRMQRLLVPSIMPAGLDPHQVIEERNHYIDARIDQRIRELESLPAMMGDGGLENPLGEDEKEKENANEPPSLEQLSHPPPSTHGKLRAMIELKALRVLDKQRQMRASVAERLMHGSLLRAWFSPYISCYPSLCAMSIPHSP